MYSLDFRIVIIKEGEIVEAMPSKIILMMPKNQESSKFQRIKSQASFKNQDQDSRFKNQDSSKESRLKIQESREDSIKISIKRVFQKLLNSTILFKREILPKSFTLW